MPILDQGYQHWNGVLTGHAWRWLAISRQGIRAQLRNRTVRYVMLSAWIPALVLGAFLVIWGLFEQKSSLLTPFLMLTQNLPEELKAGPRGYRSIFWTIAFGLFFEVQTFLAMILVLQVGPDLISQDLRTNATPLYFSRPVRRIDYFIGKLGVIASFLSMATVLPAFVAYGLGVCFSLDPGVLPDTARILAASVAFGLIIVVSAGPLMLAISSLSKNSRYVSALWLALWIVGNLASATLIETIRRPWCPLISYTGNLARVREALLGTDDAWVRVTRLFEAGRDGVRQATNLGPPFGRRPRGFPFPPPPSTFESTTDSEKKDEAPLDPLKPPWTWSAGILLSLTALSFVILSLRVRSLDRVR